ncbi:hypothetical protein C8R45DRAFT_1102107 [Mycena sanguinolenta]|nr:hypothetical protein C8R45DRAFT_1102107 [Mycena sanguinolenta]
MAPHIHCQSAPPPPRVSPSSTPFSLVHHPSVPRHVPTVRLRLHRVLSRSTLAVPSSTACIASPSSTIVLHSHRAFSEAPWRFSAYPMSPTPSLLVHHASVRCRTPTVRTACPCPLYIDRALLHGMYSPVPVVHPSLRHPPHPSPWRANAALTVCLGPPSDRPPPPAVCPCATPFSVAY